MYKLQFFQFIYIIQFLHLFFVHPALLNKGIEQVCKISLHVNSHVLYWLYFQTIDFTSLEAHTYII